MAHLVDEQQHHEAEGKGPAPEQRVGRHRHERRTCGRKHLELGQEQEQALDGGEELDDQRRGSFGIPVSFAVQVDHDRRAVLRRVAQAAHRPLLALRIAAVEFLDADLYFVKG